jgi:cytochrome c oxidase subunit 2
MRTGRRSFLAVVAVGAAAAFTGGGVLRAAGDGEKVVKVVARKFVFLPSDITLRQGEPAVLEFTAPEVVMGFYVPDLKLRTDIIPGQVARLALTPDRIGTFPFLCDVFCGDGHEGMNGVLHVVG